MVWLACNRQQPENAYSLRIEESYKERVPISHLQWVPVSCHPACLPTSYMPPVSLRTNKKPCPLGSVLQILSTELDFSKRQEIWGPMQILYEAIIRFPLLPLSLQSWLPSLLWENQHLDKQKGSWRKAILLLFHLNTLECERDSPRMRRNWWWAPKCLVILEFRHRADKARHCWSQQTQRIA